MRRFLYAILVGIVGAGIVHGAILVLLPSFSAAETWRRVEQALPPDRMSRAELFLFAPDPFFRIAACRLDLRNGAARLRAEGAVAGWTVSVYAPDGGALANLNDRGASGRILDLILLTSAQRKAGETIAPQSTPVEVEAQEALAVLEVFMPDGSWSASADAFLASADCKPA